jgi:hypothetical protein
MGAAVLALVLAVTGSGCDGGDTDSTAARRACARLDAVSAAEQFSDFDTVRDELKAAQRWARRSGNGELESQIDAAVDAFTENRRADDPPIAEYLPRTLAIQGHRTLAEAECARLGHHQLLR